MAVESERYAEVIITANDDAAGIVSFSQAQVTVQEDADAVIVDVVRQQGHFGAVRRGRWE